MVATGLGTAKVEQALQPGGVAAVVHLDWLKESIKRWQRLDEARFQLHDIVARPKPAHGGPIVNRAWFPRSRAPNLDGFHGKERVQLLAAHSGQQKASGPAEVRKLSASASEVAAKRQRTGAAEDRGRTGEWAEAAPMSRAERAAALGIALAAPPAAAAASAEAAAEGGNDSDSDSDGLGGLLEEELEAALGSEGEDDASDDPDAEE